MTGDQKKDGNGRLPEPQKSDDGTSKPGLTVEVILPEQKPEVERDPSEPDFLEKPDDEHTRKKDEMLKRHGVPPQTTG